MITTPKRGKSPVIKHNLDKELKNGVKKIVKAFTKKLEDQEEKFIGQKYIKKEHLFKDDKIRADVLCSLRKKLVFTLRKGMLERDDLETEIAVLAAMVWFGRLKKEQQDQILEGM
jgi:HD-GYP domain-containing protein (c-di-GMP phosphodiesterase class II)